MASAVGQKPAQDYFTLPSQRPQNNTSTSPFVWDSSSYEELPSPETCSSFLPSPVSPILAYPPTAPYTLPKTEDLDANSKTQDPIFNFGTFDRWMGWDDPTDNVLSPASDFFPELKLEPMSPNLNSLELASPANADAPVFGGDNVPEEPMFQTPKIPTSVPEPRENLYSTPLSWTRPSAGPRRSTYASQVRSSEELAKLRDIAMPASAYPGSPSSVSSPEPQERNQRKRKSPVEEEDEDEESPPPSSNGRHPPKKTAHNMIEKRYRTNLNEKIAALRDSVPALRVMTKKGKQEAEEDLQGLTPAHKLNKATVLSKATEYIAHLEKRNKALNKENASLKSRVEAFEILMLNQQSPNVRPASRTQGRNWSS